jgi:hypothetical protein
VPTSKVTVLSSNTDGCESVFLIGKAIIMIGNDIGNGKGEFIAKMDLTKPEGFGLEFLERSLNPLTNHLAPI